MEIEKKLKKHLLHFGVHFLTTFGLAVYWMIYCLINRFPYFEMIIGFLLVMFSGFLIDTDHFLGNWERIKQVILGFKQGQISIGKAKPEKINYFHTWKFFIFFVIILFLIFLFWNKILAILSFIAYFMHMFIIDSFNNELNWCPSSPTPGSIYNFLYPKSRLFRKLCWGNREKQKED